VRYGASAAVAALGRLTLTTPQKHNVEQMPFSPGEHPFSLPSGTAVGPVALTVADLGVSEPFYRDVLGFRPLERTGDGNTLALGAAGSEAPLLLLTEQPGARPKPARATGLYHFAVLFPDRRDLARALARLLQHRYSLQGASDHWVSEALYLADPDGNGIELYRDRPREAWKHARDGSVAMATDPLNLEGLLGELRGEEDTAERDLPAGTIIGHVHLHVGDLAAAERFYHGVLGFDVTMRSLPGALFVSAGGYHHHLGLNTWAGVGAPPPPPDAAGLRHFAVRLPDTATLHAVQERLQEAGIATESHASGLLAADPSGNRVLLTSGN